MRTPIVAGNWKLNCTRDGARALARSVASGAAALGTAPQIIVCPVCLHLADVGEELEGSPVRLGAQDVSDQQLGAYTGEVAAAMLREFGCGYSIVGHSERRHEYAQSDALTAAKFAAAQAAGLVPIYCVGETRAQYEAGETEAVVARQLAAVTGLLGEQAFSGAVIAYEPVWAIGTGLTATPQQAQDVHAFIRSQLSGADAIQVLYGGSVKPGNAAELFAMPDIDGGLIGGAALQAEDFLAICAAARTE